jgi:hypothetical protein
MKRKRNLKGLIETIIPDPALQKLAYYLALAISIISVVLIAAIYTCICIIIIKK